MYDRFTAIAVHTMRLANQSAGRWGHDFIGTEHILLGLVRNTRSPTESLLTRHGLSGAVIKHQLEQCLSRGDAPIVLRRRRPSVKAQDVIRESVVEADSLCHDFIGTEHLLLALLRVQSGVAFSILNQLGMEYSEVRGWVARDLGVQT